MSEPLANLDLSKLLFFSEATPEAVDASQQGDDPTTFARTFKRTQRAMVGKGGSTPVISAFVMPTYLDE